MTTFIADTSYISNMLDYYPPTKDKFNFVWKGIETKINEDKIIVIDKVYTELKNKKDSFIDWFLIKIKDKVVPTSEKENIELAKIHHENKNSLSGSFDNFAKETSADLSIIGKAKEMRASILTDEIMPEKPKKNGKKRLNIPSFAEINKIKCLQLKDSINIIIE